MSVLSARFATDLSTAETGREAEPKPDWPLMCDVASCRAGVPEALIRWRAARGEAAPMPSDPEFRRRQNSL